MIPEDFKVLFIYPNTVMATLLPINISLLSACLKNDNFQVELFDTTYYRTEDDNMTQKKVGMLQIKPYSFEDEDKLFKKTDIYDDLKNKVLEYRPNLIAITLVEDTIDLAKDLLKSVRGYYDCPIVSGGVYAFFSPEELIEEDFIDIVCVGEGEKSLVELCHNMVEGKDISNIPNLWVKNGGKVKKNAMRPPIDIDSLPFLDYDVFEKSRLDRPMHGKIFRMMHVEFDRGCPFSCHFCICASIRRRYKEDNYKYHRAKSSERAVLEIEYLKNKYNPDYVNFNAESFLARSVDSLKEIADLYKERINLPFWCQSRPETITEEKLLILKDMGCKDLQYGIEHGNEEFRKKMLNRNVSNERMLEACLLTEKVGIPYTVNNILGFPEETRDLVWDTINFNRKIKPKTMNCYFFTPYKGTYLYDYCVKNGSLDSHAKTNGVMSGGEIKYDNITKEELHGLQRTFCLYATMDEKLFPEIRKAEKFDDNGNSVFNNLKEEFYKIMNW